MSTPAPAAGTTPPPKYLFPSRRTVVLMALVALAGIGLVAHAWQLWPFHPAWQATEDAYVRGQVTLLSAQVDGRITEVLVKDFDTVEAGQPLLRIDERPFRQALSQAEAALAQARADLATAGQSEAQDQARIQAARADLGAGQSEYERARADQQRYEALASRQLVSASDRDRLRSAARVAAAGVDQARAAIRVAEESLQATRVGREGLAARVAAAGAAVELARLDLEHTVVRAPRGGQLSEVGVRPGQLVANGTALLSLVPRQQWVVANFKENQTGTMAVGQPARLRVDAFPGQVLTGRVTAIAPATGSEFALLKADNASGNFTKVVQRLPVRIDLDPDQPLARRLRPGLSVVAEVDTTAPAAPSGS